MGFVVAIAGPMGAGKSALIEAVARQLGSASIIEFDASEQASLMSKEALVDWVQRGANFNELAAPRLAQNLQFLAKHQSMVLFEMPLGREYQATAKLIDFLVWLDVPLEIALARKLAQLALAGSKPDETLHWVRGFLQMYQDVVREVLLIQNERVRPNADLILNAHRPLAELAQQLTAAIRRRLAS